MINENISQLCKFATVGCLNTFIDWVVYLTIIKLFPIESIFFYAVAKGFSYLCGIVNSFFLNRHWTFKIKSSEKEKRRFFKFVVVNAIGLCISSASFYVLMSLYASHIVALFLATAITFAFNFSLNKLWVFRESKMVPKTSES